MIFLFALLVSFIGAWSAAYDAGRYWFWWIFRFICYTLIMWLINWLALIPFTVRTTVLMSLILLFVTCVIDWFRWGLEDWGYGEGGGAKTANFTVSCVCLGLFLCFWGASCNAWYANDLFQLAESQRLESKAFNQDPISEKNIVVVSKETALWKAQRAISQGGNYGAFYQFCADTMIIQRVNGRLYWCAPMEFGGIGRQWSQKSSPGFIMVSAENYDEEPKLTTKNADGSEMKLRYMVHSSWGLNLNRYLRAKFPGQWFMDLTFEVDEELRTWQVATWVRPTKWFTDGWQVLGVIIVDPETGDYQEYTLDNVPSWVDRAIPEEVAVDYLKWWGKYHHGWRFVKSWEPYKEDMKPTHYKKGYTDVRMVYGEDGEPYWFSGFTSFKKEDKALVGKGFINSRTGKYFFVPSSGSDEEAIANAVEKALPKLNTAVVIGCPVPYNLYGKKNSWVVPVIASSRRDESHEATESGQSGQLLRVAIVDGDTLKVTIGDTKNEALLLLKKQLGIGYEVALSEKSKLAALEGVISAITQVIEESNSEFRFQLKDALPTFSCGILTADGMSTAIEFAKPGDRIQLEYEETSERVVPVFRYKILGQKEVMSAEQKGMLEMKRQQKETEARWEGKQIENIPSP
ncbi:MAG: hypothetical protein WC650_05760 [Candidatus Doudnabacteria bacterium]